VVLLACVASSWIDCGLFGGKGGRCVCVCVVSSKGMRLKGQEGGIVGLRTT
jgi:hypothetical protein